ncbi:class I SAM-dependent methyltransferase [Methanothrix sp.]|uniref:class I SAM-dependent methyltransferase n=1 Tax=Methanothrix sp. TaxID=90426 RepID=UPI001BD647B9
MSSYSAYSGTGSDQLDPFDSKDSNLWRKAEYLGRYLFAADFLRHRSVGLAADISCGLGYGSAELASIFEEVVGIDSSQRMIDQAMNRYKLPNVRFICLDLEEDDLCSHIPPESCGAVVSFETLEHLNDPGGAADQISRILMPEGFLICSVPNVIYEAGDDAGLPKNRSHKQWFSFPSLSRMVEGCGMRVIYRLGQSRSRALFRREQQLFNAGRIEHRLTEEQTMHSPEMIRWLSYVAAYPTVEDVDGSYSIIIVAQKRGPE